MKRSAKTKPKKLSANAAKFLKIINSAFAVDTPRHAKYANADKGMLNSAAAEEFLRDEFRKSSFFGNPRNKLTKAMDELIEHGYMTKNTWHSSIETSVETLECLETATNLSHLEWYRLWAIQHLRNKLGLDPLPERHNN